MSHAVQVMEEVYWQEWRPSSKG